METYFVQVKKEKSLTLFFSVEYKNRGAQKRTCCFPQFWSSNSEKKNLSKFMENLACFLVLAPYEMIEMPICSLSLSLSFVFFSFWSSLNEALESSFSFFLLQNKIVYIFFHCRQRQMFLIFWCEVASNVDDANAIPFLLSGAGILSASRNYHPGFLSPVLSIQHSSLLDSSLPFLFFLPSRFNKSFSQTKRSKIN